MNITKELSRLLYLHTLDHHACWNEKNTKEEYDNLIKKFLKDQEKAELFDNLMPILRKELSKEQLEVISVLIDPLSRKILAYLVVTEEDLKIAKASEK